MPAVVAQATRTMFMRAPLNHSEHGLTDLRRGMKMHVGRRPAFGLTGDAGGLRPATGDDEPRRA